MGKKQEEKRYVIAINEDAYKALTRYSLPYKGVYKGNLANLIIRYFLGLNLDAHENGIIDLIIKDVEAAEKG